jgi:hypothetical protein
MNDWSIAEVYQPEVIFFLTHPMTSSHRMNELQILIYQLQEIFFAAGT